MSENTPAASGFVISDDDLDESLNALFSPDLNLEVPSSLSDAVIAFQNLVGLFVNQNCPAAMDFLVWDYLGIQLFIKRFHRDAFGVSKFTKYVDSMIADGKLRASERENILRQISRLGIRINSDAPRKTRIAAAFSLWMSTFRPVHLSGTCCPGISPDQAETICGSANLWIATTFLSKFGEIDFGAGKDAEIRLARIPYDFTYRSINLSSLEILYSSLLRVKPAC